MRTDNHDQQSNNKQFRWPMNGWRIKDKDENQCVQIGKSGSAYPLGGAHGRGKEGQSDPGDIFIHQFFFL